MSNKCAPGKNYNNGTCFTLDNLIHLATDYNNRYPDNQITIKKDKKYLLKMLTSRMKQKYNCNDQTCWIQQNFITDKKIKTHTFRPIGPTKKYEWMSTTNIDDVMKQYEEKYTDFLFYGAVPYDFEELEYLPTYNFNINKIPSNINQIGMVINLDTSNKSGSHWVALYINRKKEQVYFFDSFGKKPGKRIARFVKYFYNDMKKRGLKDKDVDVRFNKIQHQFGNSECGVYSMNFIIRLLNGETFDGIVNNITNDKTINDCRKTYFRNLN